jgi:3,4-dihydroxy 2-butanone 4-phosphate synthase
MNQTLLTRFGSPIERVEKAINTVRSGQGVLITDDENRESAEHRQYVIRFLQI